MPPDPSEPSSAWRSSPLRSRRPSIGRPEGRPGASNWSWLAHPRDWYWFEGQDAGLGDIDAVEDELGERVMFELEIDTDPVRRPADAAGAACVLRAGRPVVRRRDKGVRTAIPTELHAHRAVAEIAEPDGFVRGSGHFVDPHLLHVVEVHRPTG